MINRRDFFRLTAGAALLPVTAKAELLSGSAIPEAVYPYMLSYSESIVSAGTGVQALTLHGVDETGSKVSETIKLNGLTPVNTVNVFRGEFTIEPLT